MNRIAVVAAVVLSAALAAPSAQASESRAATTTTFTVQPGAKRTVFHDGDPIRLCFSTLTKQTQAKPVVISIDQRQGVEDAKWESAQLWRAYPNRPTCWTTGVTVDGPEDPDLLLRARTITGPDVNWSVSPVRRLDLGDPD
jgi:hypothetical protein